MGDRDPVTAEHERLRFDGASYLLGALDEADRALFEAHLHECRLCQAELAELAELPTMLDRADGSAWHPEGPPETLLPRLLGQVVAVRRQRARRAAFVGLVAACLAAVLALGAVTAWQHQHQPRALTMQALAGSERTVHATVRLTGAGASTRIRLDCGYYGTAAYPGAGSEPSYRMVVFNRQGQWRELGDWTPLPGEDVRIDRASPWPRQNLSRIEVSDAAGRPVLRLSL
jgi:hypothetical protein